MKKMLCIFTMMLTLSFCLAPVASATLFDFSYMSMPDTIGTPLSVSAQGVLITEPIGNAQYLVTGITGQRNGIDIVSLFPAGPGPTKVYDSLGNVAAIVDNIIVSELYGIGFWDITNASGIVYTTADGMRYDPYSGLTGRNYEFTLGGSGGVIEVTTFMQMRPVPVPATIILLGSGLIGLFFKRRSR